MFIGFKENGVFMSYIINFTSKHVLGSLKKKCITETFLETPMMYGLKENKP